MVVTLLGSGCATVSWYGQAVHGQLDLLCRREPIIQLINDSSTDPELHRRLVMVLEMREFASEQLGLPDSGSYSHYADLERDAAVWNVIAAERFEMEARTWCYPIAGCLAYRGYFNRDRATAYAERLNRRGYDVAVSPAVAYSTLGWFADPVLNTMLAWDDARLAGFIFHELAHEGLFVPGATEFNEAYATVVEREGVRRWLNARQDDALLAEWERDQMLTAALVGILLDTRQALIELYARDLSPAETGRLKVEIFDRLRMKIRGLGERHQTDRFSGWLTRDLNNAHLVAIATYESGTAAFEQLLSGCDGDLECFHDRVGELAAASGDVRREFLREPAI